VEISKAFAPWQRYCTASSSGRQPNFAALNRGRHLCSAGRPSCRALAHILVDCIFLWLFSSGASTTQTMEQMHHEKVGVRFLQELRGGSATRTIPLICAKTVLQLLTHCYLLHLQQLLVLTMLSLIT